MGYDGNTRTSISWSKSVFALLQASCRPHNVPNHNPAYVCTACDIVLAVLTSVNSRRVVSKCGATNDVNL